MNNKTEGTLAIIAALVVLFSAMWSPMVSLAIAVVALAAFGVYALTKKPEAAGGSIGGGASEQTRHKESEKQAILGLMATGNEPLTNEHVRQMLGISESTATRYFDELEKEGKVRQVGKTGAHVFYEKKGYR